MSLVRSFTSFQTITWRRFLSVPLNQLHSLPRTSIIPTTTTIPPAHKRFNYNLPVTPNDQLPAPPEEPEGSRRRRDDRDEPFRWGPTLFKMFEAAATTFASVAILGAVGYGYTIYYKRLVLSKIEHAFEPGDPVLDLAAVAKHGKDLTETDHWVLREEQEMIDAIVAGRVKGQYHLLVGEKGTGKSSMLIDAMAKIDGEGCAMLEAHADPEIFRIRLGKALDFEFHEDNIGALFSIRGPRDANAILDVERAFNKLEKIMLQRRNRVGRPLIIIIGSTHLLRDDEPGRDLLELLQQRAEAWAAGNLATVIFNSDDYWVYERLKQYATRMNIIPILDLSKPRAVQALRTYRAKYYSEIPDSKVLEQVYDMVGGRLSYLGRVAKSTDMLKTCQDICQTEKTWLLNKCWILGAEMDDDVMDQQKYASAAMVLAKALVDKEKSMSSTYDPVKGHILPQIPLHEARQVMTRADFIQSYDSINVFTIDSHAMVRADSVPMMNAMRDICGQEGFEDHLEATLKRIGDIESLGRTRELTIKDLWEGGRYKVAMRDGKGVERGSFLVETVPREEAGEE
ncbi:hypothetical protein BAUCODRAFT_29236 [Baudoinia panamericana UAMH 10762]|uniref:Orc1-like AAA ATPase domain-containing protein n=1 Tax=Baudoinia panamericana (strain UAMH 10762) TaxID=717646 RepID=M2M1C9_BAUPA|nr:uncharacterized protein BAUCODRAFT_29236 [Baudoinia panamericana UAMH 10762]EMD00858.1 hypothetical protein BAUCODRAFT_29236 [Baudoinia panamericana UAMH 10762]